MISVFTVEDQQQQIDTLNHQARAIWHQDVVKARELADEAQKLAMIGIFEAQTYEKGWMDSLVMQAQCGLKAGLYEEAVTRITRALNYYRDHDFFDVWQLNAHFTMGAAYATFGNQTEALNWYQKLVTLAGEMGEPAYIALGLRNIGNLYGTQQEFETAIYFYNQALPYFEQLPTRSGLASLYGNFGWIYQQSGRFEQALEYALRTLNLFQSIGNRDGESLSSILAGNLYMELSNFELATTHMITGVQIAREMGLGSYLADGLLNLGRLYTRQGNYPLAIEHARQGLSQAQTIQYKGIQMNCHMLLSQSYKQLGEWEAAFQHYEQYSLLKDEIHTQESATKLRHLEVLHRTRQAQLEAEAQRKLRDEDRRYYEQLNQMKDEILNTASHDLKSPLVGIQHTLNSLRRHGRIDDPHGQQLMLDIDKTIQQMGGLVTSVLDLAKLETGRALHPESCDFVAFVQSMLPEIEGAARREGIEFRVKLPTSALNLMFDTDRMYQVVQNLLTNAVKYTDRGGKITLAVEAKETSLIMAITDTGMGIPAYALPYVFERFYRVPDERHRQVDGTGLGLAIVKAIIEQHGGTIQVESKPNQGSTFSFSLPLS